MNYSLSIENGQMSVHPIQGWSSKQTRREGAGCKTTSRGVRRTVLMGCAGIADGDPPRRSRK